MNNDTIGVGIVGLGFMAATHLQAYEKVPGARVAALCSPSGRNLDGDFSKVAGNIGGANGLRIDMTRVKGYRDFTEMLSDPAVQVIDICAPTSAHPELVIAALQAGKHVLCEKPLARTSILAREMAELARAKNRLLMPAMCMRFWPEWRWLKEAIDSKRFGKVLSARFQRVAEPPGWGQHNFLDGAKSGGALLDLHIHDVDFVRYCFGQPLSVTARGYQKVSGALDHIDCSYEFTDGAMISGEGGWAMSPGFGFRMSYLVNFEKATADYDSSRAAPLMLAQEGERPVQLQVPGADGYEGELRYFIQCVASNAPLQTVTAEDAVAALEICEAEGRSVSLKQPVVCPEPTGGGRLTLGLSAPADRFPGRFMSNAAPVAPQKINLRRPEIMEQVQAQVLSHYRSELVDRIRARGNELSAEGLTIRLAKEFGFCYGVERAIDLAYAARKSFPADKPIYLLGEIIHNPEVNFQIQNLGIKTLSPKPTEEEISRLNKEDVVIIPAFGTQVATRKQIEERGCIMVDTTCGDVMSVWKRVRQYSKDAVTSIIHGKAKHEETKATTSQATAYGSGHYLVVFNLEETDAVCNYILNGGNKEEFLAKFKGAYSEGFDPDQHLQAIGVANQTTMLRGETEEVQRRLREVMVRKYGAADIDKHFRFFDTICGATQDRQDALEKLLRDKMDLLLVVGGYNSSNTSHLAEMGEAILPTYFIKNAAMMASDKLIRHWNQHTSLEVETNDWLPSGNITVGITAGASCPNNLIEDTIRRLFELRGISVVELLKN